MAGSGRKVFTPGEVLTASNVMNFLQDQAVMVFPDSGARGSAIGSAVSDGMVSYLTDTNSVEVYKTSGTALANWENNTVQQSPNVIINGGFDIWQRGATINSIGNTAYSADMWSVVTDGVGTVNVTRQDVAAQGFGSRYALRAERSAGTNRWVVIGMFEGALAYVGKTMTLSGYIREGSALTSDISVSVSARTAKFGTAFDSASTTISNASLSTSTFRRFSLTFPVTTATSTAGADLFQLEFSATQAGASNVFFELAGLQLEAGSTATPFRRNANSIAGELAACQRYFQRYSSDGVTVSQFAQGIGYSTTGVFYQFLYRTPFRIAPTSLSSSGTFRWGNGITAGTFTTLALASDTTSTTAGLVNASGSSGLAGGSPYRLDGPSAGGFIDFSAEL